MKQIKLLSLQLKNFKGIKDFLFSPDGRNSTIYGANGVGKSSLADAFNWLLFDKNSAGAKDFGLKPTDNLGREINNLEHCVAATIAIDGLTCDLAKVMTEKWAKKRGSSAPEFSGHETAYFINDVPTQKAEYDKAIADICGSDTIFRLLTSTTFFNSMKWQDRRIILLDVAGNISDADVISANPQLAELTEILGNRSLVDHLKVLKAQRPKINSELEKLPARMDEAGRDKPSEISVIPPAGNYADLKTGYESLLRQRAAMLAGDTSEFKKSILAIQEEMHSIRSTYLAATRKAEDDRRFFSVAFDKSTQQKEDQERNISRLKNDVAACGEMREKLIAAWKVNHAETLPDEVCNMGMAASEHPSYDAAKALSEFNNRKAEKIKRNSEAGKANNSNKEAFECLIFEAEAKISTLDTEIQLARESFDAVVFPAEPDYTLMQEAIKALEADISSKSTPSTAKIDEEIDTVQMQICSHDAAALNLRRTMEIETRIAELKQEQKVLVIEVEKIDKHIMLCEQFTRAKVSMLTDSVNNKFAPLSFKLFAEQINGGIAECCEVMRDGVPYGDLSRGQKAVAGLSIIGDLSLYYDITCPVFIDDAEGITLDLPHLNDGQYFRLCANKAFSLLTFESEINFFEQGNEVGNQEPKSDENTLFNNIAS
jgi:energy-coupling factor transporter ATP-binding protein EcfA2